MGETLDAQVAFLQRQLHAINLAIGQAKARNDQDAINRLKALYVEVAAKTEALKREALASDAPAAFMVALDNFGDEVIATGKELGVTVLDTAKGVASVAKYLPIIIVVALVVVGLVYAGKIRKDLQ